MRVETPWRFRILLRQAEHSEKADLLPFDPANPVTNGVTNGRSLMDDVIDNELPLVTNGLVTTDCVGPHTDYRSTFPFLGAPH